MTENQSGEKYVKIYLNVKIFDRLCKRCTEEINGSDLIFYALCEKILSKLQKDS